MIKYQIGEREFFLKPVTAGQIIQLLPILTKAPMDDFYQWLSSIGEDVFRCIAIILTPAEGKKDLKELEEYLSSTLPPQALVDIMNDFFVSMQQSLAVKYKREEIS